MSVWLVSSPGQGHLNPILSLAEVIKKIDGLPVCLVVPVNEILRTPVVIDAETANSIHILEIQLPKVRGADDILPAFCYSIDNRTRLVHYVLDYIKFKAPKPFNSLLACVYDMYSTWFQDVADLLNVPASISHPSPAFFALLQFNWLKQIRDQNGDDQHAPVRNSDDDQHAPVRYSDDAPVRNPDGDDQTSAGADLERVTGLKNVNPADLPMAMFNDGTLMRRVSLNQVANWTRAKGGLLINDHPSWYSAEFHAQLKSQNHKVHFIGPLLSPTEEQLANIGLRLKSNQPPQSRPLNPAPPRSEGLEKLLSSSSSEGIVEKSESVDAEIAWLDQFPERSAIYISFGTIFTMSSRDLRVFSEALLKMRRPFLWAYKPKFGQMVFSEKGSVRGESEGGKSTESDGLPSSFRDMSKSFGKITKWVDQRAALRHPSVALFITHAGWNSVLECAVEAGLPMLLIPFEFDQKLIAHFVETNLQTGQRLPHSFDCCDVEKSILRLLEPQALTKAQNLRNSITLTPKAFLPTLSHT